MHYFHYILLLQDSQVGLSRRSFACMVLRVFHDIFHWLALYCTLVSTGTHMICLVDITNTQSLIPLLTDCYHQLRQL